MRAPTGPSVHERLLDVIWGSWVSRRAGMEDARFFHQQANWCYQLAWQCFDLEQWSSPVKPPRSQNYVANGCTKFRGSVGSGSSSIETICGMPRQGGLSTGTAACYPSKRLHA